MIWTELPISCQRIVVSSWLCEPKRCRNAAEVNITKPHKNGTGQCNNSALKRVINKVNAIITCAKYASE